MNALQTRNQPTTSIQYDLQVLRAAINTLTQKDNIPTAASNALLELLETGCTTVLASHECIGAARQVSSLTAKAIQKTYKLAVNAYRTKWYIKTLYIKALAQQVIIHQDAEALKNLQSLLPRTKKKKSKKTTDWQIIHAGIEALAGVVA